MRLYWHNYNYLGYEKDFSIMEARALLNPNKLVKLKDHLRLEGNFSEDKISKLVYFSKAEINGNSILTLQHKLEQKCNVFSNGENRQSTRYSVHGAHSYKGKFNPQVVRSILNILNIKEGSNILDPFCGSGTSLVECFFAKQNCIGFDTNPLAIFVANAKIESLKVSPNKLMKEGKKIVDLAKNGGNHKLTLNQNSSPRITYLQKWFPEKYLADIELLKQELDKSTFKHKQILYVLASNLLRDYSNQEPTDLRIRKRFSEFPKEPFFESYLTLLSCLTRKLKSTQEQVPDSGKTIVAKNIDSSEKNKVHNALSRKNSIDAGITSPPYAMALPYIDTQRLSLVWLDLLQPSEIRQADQELIGSREYINGDQGVWESRLDKNTDGLPFELHSYCMKLKSFIGKDDGFRRKAVPSLLYLYFVGMGNVFENILPYFKKNAPLALIVGHNSTTLGNKLFNIDTPNLLLNLALSKGWKEKEITKLQTYKRYQLHKKNSINEESLIIIQRK